MSINLPDIIQQVAQSSAPAPVFKAQVNLPIKKMVICVTKDLSDEDRKLFAQYGKITDYDDRMHCNLPIDSFEWDYIVFDMRESEDRYALMKQVLPFKDKYNVLVYSYAFEKDEIVPDADNHISKLPKQQARREDFESLLMMKRLVKPRWYASLLNCVLGWYHQAKN